MDFFPVNKDIIRDIFEYPIHTNGTIKKII